MRSVIMSLGAALLLSPAPAQGRLDRSWLPVRPSSSVLHCRTIDVANVIDLKAVLVSRSRAGLPSSMTR
jgi:hypothetical protein